MGNNAISPYQQVIEKTKSLSFRSQMLTMNIEKKQAHKNEASNTRLYIPNAHRPLLSAQGNQLSDQIARSIWTQGSSKLLKWSAQKNKGKECWWTTINKSSLYTK